MINKFYIYNYSKVSKLYLFDKTNILRRYRLILQVITHVAIGNNGRYRLILQVIPHFAVGNQWTI